MSTQAYSHFQKSIKRTETLLEVHKFLTQKSGRPLWWASDVLRAAVVLIMSSWDSYVHDVIQENASRFIRSKKGKDLPKKLVEILKDAIPYEKMLEIWHEEKPDVIISTAIRKRNAERTFMKPDKAEDALRVLGIVDVWKSAAKYFNRRKDGLKTVFEGYAKRRDQIAHEGDMGKATRSKGRLRSIRRPYIDQCLADVQKLAKIVDGLIASK